MHPFPALVCSSLIRERLSSHYYDTQWSIEYTILCVTG
jgi:hypothetical protein